MRDLTVSALCGLPLLLFAAPAGAEGNAELLDFMGGQGCTIGADSRTAATGAGFAADAIDALAASALANGTGQQQGDYLVLDRTVCTILLPEIQSRFTVDSPEIRAIISPMDHYAADGERGCFLMDPIEHFIRLYDGDEAAAQKGYIAFLAAGIISGNLRFYAPSPLATPVSWQVLSGDCSDVPNIQDIRRSHAFIASGFGEYIRLTREETRCEDAPADFGARDFSVAQQGADPQALLERTFEGLEVNAWIWFEYDLITMAAGWHEGVDPKSRGNPRPPLCHMP